MDEKLEKRVSVFRTSSDFLLGFGLGVLIEGIDHLFNSKENEIPILTMNIIPGLFGSIIYYNVSRREDRDVEKRLAESSAYFAGIVSGSVLYSGARIYFSGEK